MSKTITVYLYVENGKEKVRYAENCPVCHAHHPILYKVEREVFKHGTMEGFKINGKTYPLLWEEFGNNYPHGVSYVPDSAEKLTVEEACKVFANKI